MRGEGECVWCFTFLLSVVFFALGGWQCHKYQSGRNYEASLEWHVCNMTSWQTRAIGFFVCNGGDQGKDVHYLMGAGDGKSSSEIVAFYV